MVLEALTRFNNNLNHKNAAFNLSDDAELFFENYNLRVAKQNGYIEPQIA